MQPISPTPRRRPCRLAPAGLLALGLLAAAAAPCAAQRTDVPVHDPVMTREGDTYYLFATGRGISVWSSPDLQSWTREPPVFQESPAWTEEVVPGFRGHIWAPDVYHHDGRYYLYYSVSAFGRNTSAIGVASTPTLDRSDPRFGWTDHGKVVESVPGRDLWNAIDPNIVRDDQGRAWMSFGSFWEGLKLVQLDPSLTALAQPERWRTIAARHRYWKLDERDAGDPMNGAVEAPFIFRKDGWYYLFVSWDRCCRGAESTYKVVVGRSRDIQGPYLDREGEELAHGGGSLVVHGFGEGGRWAAGGHNSAYTFDGTDYLVLHAYDLSDEGRSKLLVREIQWDAQGWPSVSVRE